MSKLDKILDELIDHALDTEQEIALIGEIDYLRANTMHLKPPLTRKQLFVLQQKALIYLQTL